MLPNRHLPNTPSPFHRPGSSVQPQAVVDISSHQHAQAPPSSLDGRFLPSTAGTQRWPMMESLCPLWFKLSSESPLLKGQHSSPHPPSSSTALFLPRLVFSSLGHRLQGTRLAPNQQPLSEGAVHTPNGGQVLLSPRDCAYSSAEPKPHFSLPPVTH